MISLKIYVLDNYPYTIVPYIEEVCDNCRKGPKVFAIKLTAVQVSFSPTNKSYFNSMYC